VKKKCCGSGMFIPDPDFYPSRIPDLGSRIPDPKTATKERGEKKICRHIFFCNHKFYRIENYLIFGMLKKFGPIFKELYNFLLKKLSLSSQKYGFGIWDPEKTYPGSRGQKSTGSRIRIRNTDEKCEKSQLFFKLIF
jgi:hypothetical protein